MAQIETDALQAYEELRFALVMNGGVSLVVWMGGVTNEIFNLVRARHPVYQMLLEMTRTHARVDVISGTSAGGINGAALTLALLYDGDFSKLRDVWLREAVIGQLLRPVLGENPGSLLMGEEFFLPHIEKAFRAIARTERPQASAAEMPIDLRLTTTLLTGNHGRAVDDLGVEINDVDYRAQFHFRHGDSQDDDDFGRRDEVIPRLARAARSTASFPFAFEPSFLDRDCGLHKNLKDSNGMPLSIPRYVVDGGVLDNKPFKGALQAIFGMERRCSVRRVLAYINPDPADGPIGKPGGKMPPVGVVISESILGIPQSQSISDQLGEIRDHNDAVRKRRDSVATLARCLGPHEFKELPGKLFNVYRERRLSVTFEAFVYAALPKTAANHPDLADGLRAIGKNGRAQLKSIFMAVDWQTWIPSAWPSTPQDPANQIETWAWGLFPVEFAAKVMLDMLRKAQDLVGYVSFAKAPDLAVSFSLLWHRAYAEVQALTRMRQDERCTWDENTKRLLQTLSVRVRAEGASANPVTGDDFARMFALLDEESRRQVCGQHARSIAEIVNETSAYAIEIATRSLSSNALRRVDIKEANDLQALASFLHVDVADQPHVAAQEVLYKLLELEVIEFAFNDHASLDSDTVIELVQITGDSASPLGGPSTATQKLLGLQLAHFGAFYKQSWRANDWIYGRLDGAERLINILLNPERLHRMFFRRSLDAAARIEQIGVDSIASDAVRVEVQRVWENHHYVDRIRAELAFLDSLDANLPDALPVCAEALAIRLHFEILRDELPELVRAIGTDQAQGSDVSAASEGLLRQFGGMPRDSHAPPRDVTLAQARQSLAQGLVATERLLDEAGSDLFTRTLTHSIATLENLLASKAAKLGPVSTLFASLKVPILGFYFVADGLTHQSSTSAAVNGGLLAAGFALVCFVLFMSGSTLPSVLVTLAWTMLAYGLLASVAKAPRTVGLAVWLFVFVLAVLTKGYLLGVIAAAMLLLTISVAYEPLQWLQWLIGFMAIVVAAAWEGGFLGYKPSPLKDSVYVLVLAGVVCFGLLLAIWEASPISAEAERRARKFWKTHAIGRRVA